MFLAAKVAGFFVVVVVVFKILLFSLHFLIK